jgi:acyl-CoA thioesterase YciA
LPQGWQFVYAEAVRTMTDTQAQPCGEVLLRTLAMPADTNPNGDIFGGWIMSQMDIAGSTLAKETAQGRVVTVAVDSIKFIKPVKVGDVVCCYGELVRIGTTSITVRLEIWVNPILRGNPGEAGRFKVTEATFTYVAVDVDGNKRPVRPD